MYSRRKQDVVYKSEDVKWTCDRQRIKRRMKLVASSLLERHLLKNLKNFRLYEKKDRYEVLNAKKIMDVKQKLFNLLVI